MSLDRSAARPHTALVRDMMIEPSTDPATLSLDEARAAFDNDHVHLLLLVDDGRLVGTLDRDDLAGAPAGTTDARQVAHLDGRTVDPSVSVDDALARMRAQGQRRLAVVDDGGRLVGLLCLKRHGGGFCAPHDLAARRAAREGRR